MAKPLLLTTIYIWAVLDRAFLELEAICQNHFQELSVKKEEILCKFALHLDKMATGLTLSPTHIKCAFLKNTVGIQNIEVVFEDRVDHLDLISLAEKA